MRQKTGKINKTIAISPEAYEILQFAKLELGKKNIGEVIEALVSDDNEKAMDAINYFINVVVPGE